MLTRRLLIFGAFVGAMACSLENQGAPSLAGPSELGLSLTASASPDVINQDGVSQSQISIVARDASGQPARNVSMRVDMRVSGNIADFGSLGSRSISTNNDGRASVTYTAPPEPPPTVAEDSTVEIGITPIGTDYANAFTRSVSIRLLRPGVIVAPNTELKPTFTFSPATPKIGDTVAFDASASTAGARTIVSYQWSFGDGGSATGKNASYIYTHAGTFAVRLTITDDLGRTATFSQSISLGNNLPTASFVVSPSDPLVSENVVFNAKASTAGVGRRIVSYEWDFGDRNTAFGETTFYQFGVARTYNVVLTVRDDLGQSSSTSKAVSVKDLEAIFTASPSDPTTGTTVTFNASGSKVAAGAHIASYSWDFGDGATSSTGPSASHAFSSVGTYSVTLTIQDSNGRTGTSAQTVTVKAP